MGVPSSPVEVFQYTRRGSFRTGVEVRGAGHRWRARDFDSGSEDPEGERRGEGACGLAIRIAGHENSRSASERRSASRLLHGKGTDVRYHGVRQWRKAPNVPS